MKAVLFRARGFSLIEILAAAFVFSIVSAGFMLLISGSNRSVIDGRFQALASQIAQESIEVYKAFGYAAIEKNLPDAIADYELDKWVPVPPVTRFTGIERPEEVAGFERKITLSKVSDSLLDSLVIKVSVRPGYGVKSPGRTGAFECSDIIFATGYGRR